MTDLPFILVALGVIYGITESTLFAMVRIYASVRGGTWVESLVYCPYCIGFWVGIALGFAHPLYDLSPVGSGFLIVGAVIVLRGLSPRILPGAPASERQLVNELRSAEAGSQDPGGGDAQDVG